MRGSYTSGSVLAESGCVGDCEDDSGSQALSMRRGGTDR